MTLEWGYNDGAQQIQPAGRIFYTRDPAAPKRLQSYVSYSDAIRAPLFVEGCYTPPPESLPFFAANCPAPLSFACRIAVSQRLTTLPKCAILFLIFKY